MGPLRIDGIEVTQAIQYYHAKEHLTDPADRGEDNSIRLIANKPALVRVYVRSGLPTTISGVTGTLEIQHRRWGFVYETAYTLSAELPGTVVAEIHPNYADERANLGSSLNFRIPADYMVGHMRLIVKINSGVLADELDVNLDVTLRQTLHLAGIMISYDGPQTSAPNSPNVTFSAPTMIDLQETAAVTLRLMPVQSTGTYRIAGNITWKKPLSGPKIGDGGCPQSHLDLNVEVAKAIVADQNHPDVIYYGLFPVDTPGSTGGGCSTAPMINGTAIKAASGPAQRPWTMAHELAHYLGLGHAPCDSTGGDLGSNYDPLYPAYEPYESVPIPTPQGGIMNFSIAHGILGEYAFDIDSSTIYPPTSFDLMSYCASLCFGLYHYGRLIWNGLLDPTLIDDTPWWSDYVTMVDPHFPPKLWLPDPPLSDPLHFKGIKLNARAKAKNPESLISVIGLVHSDKEVEVRNIVRLQAYSTLVGGKKSEFIVELIDTNGKILSSAPLYKMPSSGCCKFCHDGKDNSQSLPYVFQAFLQDVGQGALIRISRDEKEIWVRPAPSGPVQIQSFNVSMKRNKSVVLVSWNIKASIDQEPEVWLQWSEKKGDDKSWFGLATGLKGNGAEIDILRIPPGVVYLRMLASDGFYTAISAPVSVRIPARIPSSAILYPTKHTKILVDSPMHLWGICTDSTGKSADVQSVTWLIDNKRVATGFDVFVKAPLEGKHRCTLRVISNRKTIEQTTSFNVVSIKSL
jgi:hypothetical protein